LAGFFYITQRAIRQMVAQGAGHVVEHQRDRGDRGHSGEAHGLEREPHDH
jgi:hypothetical protein